MRSKSEAKILEAAIELFAEIGPSAGARDIAKKAGTTTMTLYRAFRNRKEYLFEEALKEAIERSFDPGKFVLFIYEGQKSDDFVAVLLSGLQRWHSAIQPSSARLLAHGCLSGKENWRETANAALERIIAVLATTIERQLPKKQKQQFDARAAANALVSVLFQAKLSNSSKPQSPKGGKEETREVEALLKYCLEGLASVLEG